MYCRFYQFDTPPFQPTSDGDFLWQGRPYLQSLKALKYGLEQHCGLSLLAGEAGSGKTTVVRALLESFDQSVLAGFVQDSSLSVSEFYALVGHVFSLTGDLNSRELFHEQMEQLLRRAGRRGQQVLLVLDEAQRLSDELLDEINGLLGLYVDETCGMNVCLVGQLVSPRSSVDRVDRAFVNHVMVRYQLAPLTIEETADYIQHRLRAAGCNRELFTGSTLAAVHEQSGGFPGRINLICDLALYLGFHQKCSEMTPEIICSAAEKLRFSGMDDGAEVHAGQDEAPLQECEENSFIEGAGQGRRPAFVSIAAAVLAVVLILGGGYSVYFSRSDSGKPVPSRSVSQVEPSSVHQGETVEHPTTPSPVASLPGTMASSEKPEEQPLPVVDLGESSPADEMVPSGQVAQQKPVERTSVSLAPEEPVSIKQDAASAVVDSAPLPETLGREEEEFDAVGYSPVREEDFVPEQVVNRAEPVDVALAGNESATNDSADEQEPSESTVVKSLSPPPVSAAGSPVAAAPVEQDASLKVAEKMIQHVAKPVEKTKEVSNEIVVSPARSSTESVSGRKTASLEPQVKPSGREVRMAAFPFDSGQASQKPSKQKHAPTTVRQKSISFRNSGAGNPVKAASFTSKPVRTVLGRDWEEEENQVIGSMDAEPETRVAGRDWQEAKNRIVTTGRRDQGKADAQGLMTDDEFGGGELAVLNRPKMRQSADAAEQPVHPARIAVVQTPGSKSRNGQTAAPSMPVRTNPVPSQPVKPSSADRERQAGLPGPTRMASVTVETKASPRAEPQPTDVIDWLLKKKNIGN